MPRTKLSQAVAMTTGWGDVVALDAGTSVEVLSAQAGRVEVLDGTHRGRAGTVPTHALEHQAVIAGSNDLVGRWVEWQCADLSMNFRNAFRQELEKCLLARGTLLLRALNHALIVHGTDTGTEPLRINASAANARQRFQTDPASDCVVLFRFYSGDAETLLPPALQKPVPGRVEPSQPARLEQERPSNPALLLRKKMAGGPSSSAQADRETAHAHQEGFQAKSPFVSCSYNLPRLLRTPSTKVRIIIFGSACNASLAGYAQATHLGVFLVPRAKLGDVIWKMGEMACLEREVTFNGVGLQAYELFTLRNPFHQGSPHQQDQPDSVKLTYFH